MEKIVISPSGKFKVIKKDNQKLNADNKKTRQITIIDTIIDKEIASYEQEINNTKVCEFFFTCNNEDGINEEWWVSGYWYMHRIFVNCDTGKFFENPMNKEGEQFIWMDCMNVSPNGKYLFIFGCYWACPYEINMFRFCPKTAHYEYIDFFDDDDEEDMQKMKPLFGSDEKCYEYDINRSYKCVD
jgi:hypothetical protein